jgi:hypothetical protein
MKNSRVPSLYENLVILDLKDDLEKVRKRCNETTTNKESSIETIE